MTDLSSPVPSALRDDPGDRAYATLFDGGLELEAGGHLDAITVAYETWGALNPTATNAVLVLHALTGDSHAAGKIGPAHPSPGWWDGLVGPGGPIDTDRCFVVCPNVLGGCGGTTGPASGAPDGQALRLTVSHRHHPGPGDGRGGAGRPSRDSSSGPA